MSLFVMDLVARQKTFYLKINHDKGTGLSNNLAKISTLHVVAHELDGLQELLTTYKEMPGLEYAMIISFKGIVLAHTNENFLGLKPTDSVSAKLKPVNATQVLLEDDQILDVASPITKGNEIVGWARIGLSQTYLTANLSEIEKRGLMYILISIVLGSLFAVIVADKLARGLQKLVSAADKIKEGKRNLRVAPSKSIEVTQLGIAINQMLDDISANEKLLSLMLENLPVGVWMLDEKGNITSTNPAGREMWKGFKYVGMDDFHLYKGWFTETGRPVQDHQWGAAIAVTEGRRVLNQEIEIECFDKSHKIILNSGIPLRDGAGKLAGAIAIEVDITERKESELLFKNLVEKSLVGVYIIQGGKFIYVNPKFARDLYYSREDLLALDDVRQIVDDSYVPVELEEWRTKLASGIIDDFHIELKYRRKDGKVIWAEVFCGETLYKGAKAILGTFNDITERKEAEVRIRESEEKFRMSFMTSQDAFYIGTLQEGRILDVNNSFCNLFGFTREESIGKTSDELRMYVYPEDRERMVTGLKTNGSLKDLELPCRKKNGELIIVSITVNVWQMNNEQVIMAVIRDITERKRSEEALFKANQRLELASVVAGIAVWEMDFNAGKMISKNKIWDEVYGLENDDIQNQWNNCVHEDDRETIWKNVKDHFEGKTEKYFHEFRFTNPKTGNEKWISDVGKVIEYHKDGGPAKVIGISIDITERKKAEAVIKEQGDIFEAIIENANESIWLLSPDLRVLQFNKTGKDRIWLNGGKEIYHGANFRDFLHRGTENIFMPMFTEALSGKYSEQETSQADIRGNIFWLRTRMYPIYNTLKKLIGVTVLTENITNRKEIEIKIEQSEERNRALIENITDAILLLDETLKPIYRSPSVTKILGFPREEMTDKSIFDSIHPDDLPKSRIFFQKVYTSPGIPIQSQFRLLHKYGHYIWVEGTINNMLGNKSINAIIVNYRDITERRNFEEQQLLIASIVNSSDDAIISQNLKGIITYWNKGAQKVLGHTLEETIGRHISIIIPDDLNDEVETILQRIRGGQSVDHYGTRRVRKDGVIIDTLLTISPITDSLGNIIGASKILRDITESKKAEERIKQSESNYRQLFDNSPAPMWVIDERTSAVIQVNRACIKNYGYSEKEFRGMTIREFSPGEKVFASKMNMNDQFFMGSDRHVKKSGELIDVVTSSIPVMLNGERRILMTAIDVTEKSLYEQKLTKAAIHAQEEERYEIGGELHDNICQILVSALIYLKMMKDSLPPGLIEYFNQTSLYISQAMEEIRNLSHRLAPALFDETTLEDAFKDLLHKFNIEGKFQILLRFDRFAKKRGLARDLQLNLYRILQEQLRNISKHAKATKLEVGMSIYNDVLIFRIVDNGVGLSSEQSRKGIGLANMKRRAGIFSGSFEIFSRAGGGCEVRVEVPLAKSSPIKEFYDPSKGNGLT